MLARTSQGSRSVLRSLRGCYPLHPSYLRLSPSAPSSLTFLPARTYASHDKSDKPEKSEKSGNSGKSDQDRESKKTSHDKKKDGNDPLDQLPTELRDFLKSSLNRKGKKASGQGQSKRDNKQDNGKDNDFEKDFKSKLRNKQQQSEEDNSNNPFSRFASGFSSSSGGGGGGGGGGPNNSQNQGPPLIFLGLISYLLYSYATSESSRKELTWQTFRSDFLDKGLVKSLTVVNNSSVLVTLVKDAPPPSDYDYSRNLRDEVVISFSIGSVDAFERNLDQAQKELGIPPHERIPVAFHEQISWFNTALSLAPTALLIAFLFYVSRRAAGGAGGGGGGGGGIFNIGKSKAKMFNQETDVKVKFPDVAGMDEAKEEIMEFVNFLKDPHKYERLGAKIPRGAILSGPPGTGKTLLAKATAGEAAVPFLSVSGSEFVEMFVGVGPSRVRDLFTNAKKNAPCIIFVDEIDAIGKSRGRGGQFGGNDERESTLNQLLVEMDGFGTDEHIVVLAGTNRPDVLDPALLRPGRFDRHISIDRPDVSGRRQIFKVHLKPLVLREGQKSKVQESQNDEEEKDQDEGTADVGGGRSTVAIGQAGSSDNSTSDSITPMSAASHEPGKSEDSDVSSKEEFQEKEEGEEDDKMDTKTKETLDALAEKLAASTAGFSGADIANICNEAALIAARLGSTYVKEKHFDMAIERVVAGLEKKSRILTPDEKTTVAYHEGGHAILGHLLPGADPLVKVSIVPRGRALGYARYNPVERFLYTKEQLFDKMVMTMGGRVAEEIVFGRITTGAQDDLQKITKMATDICANYGMDSEIGRVSYGHQDGSESFQKPFSEKTGELLDVQVRELISQVHQRATKILTDRRDDLEKIANLLLEREVISREDMISIVGPRPNPDEIDKSLGYGKQDPKKPSPPSDSGGNPPSDPGSIGDSGGIPKPGLAAFGREDRVTR